MNTIREKVINLDQEKTLFWALVIAVVALVVVYMIFMNATIKNVADREQYERKLARLNIELSELEYKNISYRSEINLDTALVKGFTESINTAFVSKKDFGQNYAYNSR